MRIHFERLAIGLFFFLSLFGRPRFVQNYLTNSGWLWLGLLTVVLALTSFSFESWKRPAGKTWLLASLIFLSLVLSSTWNGATFLEERWIWRGTLAALVAVLIPRLTSLELARRYLAAPLFLVTAAAVGESLWLYLTRCGPLSPRSCYAGHFGNINMLSQFLVLSLPFHAAFARSGRKVERIAFGLLVVLAAVDVLLAGSRSSLLSLGIFAVIEFAHPFAADRKKVVIGLMMAGLLAIGLGWAVSRATVLPVEHSKGNSASYRIGMWAAAVDMFERRPGGAGPGGFEFGFLPFRRDNGMPHSPAMVEKSPHNEFLRLLSEEGALPFSLILLATVILSMRAIRGVGDAKWRLPSQFFLVLLPEAFFQFPSELWWPAFFAASAIALAINMGESRVMLSSRRAFVIAFIAAIFFFSMSVLRLTPIAPISQGKAMCRMFPDNWKACSEFAKKEIEARRPEAALEILRPVVRQRPTCFMAWHIWYLAEPNKEIRDRIACAYLDLFRGEESLVQDEVVRCPPRRTSAELSSEFEELARSVQLTQQ